MAFSPPGTKVEVQDLAKSSDDDSKGSLGFRDFFWDTIILYVVSVIVGLTAVDAVSEYIRGSDVKCYSPDRSSISDVQDYINIRCAGSLPVLEYFPAFLVIHGVLLQIPHYLWINLYNSSFTFFFSKVGELDLHSEILSKENVAVLQQLENSFSTYRQNSMFFLYKAKLWLQTFLAAAGLGVAAAFFYDSDYVFLCPTDNDTLSFDAWPLDKQVVCVFSSLRLISSIRIGYFFLLSLAILSLLVALVWTYASHPQELGAEHVAKFAFETSLQPHHYVPKLKRLPSIIRRRLMQHTLFATLPWLFGNKIETDLDFLVVMLFRTNSGVGQKLKDLQIQRTIKVLNDHENTTASLHRGDQAKATEYLEKYGAFADENLVKAETRWTFNKNRGDELNTESHNGVLNLLQLSHLNPPDQTLEIPDTIRGAILGFVARAPSNGGALCVQFDSPSMGMPYLLARVFQRVGVINFSPQAKSEDSEFAEVVSHTGNGIVSVTCRDDVMSVDKYKVKFLRTVESIWFRSEEEEAVETSFIVVGPMTKPQQQTTVNVLLELVERYMNECTILVMRPMEIGGKVLLDTDFATYTPKPFITYKPLVQDIALNRDPYRIFQWPPQSQANTFPPRFSYRSHTFELPLVCGGTLCQFGFSSYRYSSQDEEDEADRISSSEDKNEDGSKVAFMLEQ